MVISPAMPLRVMAHAEAVTHRCVRMSRLMLHSWRWSHDVRVGEARYMDGLELEPIKLQETTQTQVCKALLRAAEGPLPLQGPRGLILALLWLPRALFRRLQDT